MVTAAQIKEFIDAIGGQFATDDLEKIPEGFRELFVKNADGKTFRLDGTEDVIGLKSGLSKTRTEADTAKREFREFKQRFDGIEPENVAEMQAQLDAVADKTVIDKDGMEALRAKHVADITELHKRELVKLEAERDESRKQSEDSDLKYRKYRVRQTLTEAAIESEPHTDQIPLIVDKGLEYYELDDHENLVAFKASADGTRDSWFGSDGVSSLPPKEFFQHLRENVFPSSWPPPTGGGAPGAPGRGSSTNWRDMSPEEKIEYGRRHGARQ